MSNEMNESIAICAATGQALDSTLVMPVVGLRAVQTTA